MADLSKVKVGTLTYNLKDASARSDLSTLLGEHAVAALGAAAWQPMDATVTAGGTGLVTGGAIKDYVDAQIGTINKFDVRIYEQLPTASADTMYILALVASESAPGSYVEYITVRSGQEGSYTYAWEQIGTTEADLTNYVKKTTTIAGVDLQDNITKAELQQALELGNFAYANEGTAQVAGQTISGVEATGNIDLELEGALGYTATAATLTKGDFTPAGTITGSAIQGGTINVTLKDAASASSVSLTREDYTPAGSISAATVGGTFTALKSVAMSENDSGDIQIKGSVSAPTINLTSSSKSFVTELTGGSAAAFSEGQFTPASISEGFFAAGSTAAYSHSGFSGGSLGSASKATFAVEGLVAAIDSEDAEMLVFSAAQTSNAVTEQGTFTAAVYGTDTFTPNVLPSIDLTKFNGGSKAADTFTPNVLQGASTDSVNNVTAAALASAPVFTGATYSITTTSDTALKEVVFAGQKAENLKITAATYLKQEIDDKAFIPEAASLGFSGTTATNVLVTGVSYEKADLGTVDVKAADITLSVGNINVAGQTITVSPVAAE